MAASNRSTATAAQEQRILEALRIDKQSTDQIRALGGYQPSARIWGLRSRGYIIDSELFDGIGADGFWHKRMARYTLIAEPLPLDAKTGALSDTYPTKAEGCNPITPEPLPSAQMEIESAGSEATA